MPLDKPGKKKLKQSRLPFSPIDPKSQKKRKLSTGSENQSSKALRTEAVLSKEECISPKHPTSIEIIEDSNQDTVLEEKENLKCKSTEKITNNVETPMEDSNDGIEVLEVIEKSDSPKAASTSLKTASGSNSVTKQARKKNETVNKAKRKRESTSTSSSNIKKFFKDVGERQESPGKYVKEEKNNEPSGKPEKSESKAESEKEEQAKGLSEKSEKSKTKGKSEKKELAKESPQKSEREEQAKESPRKSEREKQAKESPGKPEKSETKADSKREEQAKGLSKSEKSKTKGKSERKELAKESPGKSEKEELAIESPGKSEKEEQAKESSGKPEKSETKTESEGEEQAIELSEKSEKSETKGESNLEEHTEDELNTSNQCSKESELNESSESNSIVVTSESGTPNSSGEEKSKDDKVVSEPKTPLQKSSLVKKKVTPKQKILEEMKKKKQEEKLKFKLQKDQEKKEKELEKQKLKEERQRKKNEEFEMKEKEKEEKRQKREEERLKREEKKEEERLKKEEERLKKEEERQKKEEEKLLAEEEEKQKQKKLKAKFARFFVPKKVDSQNQQKESENLSPNDNFVHFQVKENMRIAPVVRRSLKQKEKDKLEDVLQTPLKEVNYLQEIKQGSYVRGKSCKTFPPVNKLEDDEICEIISDEEDIDGTDVLETKSCQTKRLKAKFLKFCENNRPAYYGTWSKKSVYINGRKPFRREEIFDYDYDSDEDWEDMENGESLSDSDGEADDGGKEDANQYEVDNEFFVPHGYLSDGEGEEDQENEKETEEEEKEKDENVQKERLKQKQEEFEMEMKQKTKQLKPKVYGCVWMGDRSSHQAYDQLLKILMPYKAMVMFGTCPIDLGRKEMNNQEMKENDDEEGHEDDSGKKFVKCFPEKAVPDLIRLIHGNRHSKLFLRKEFSAFWKKKQEEEADTDSGSIAMRKIEPKIQEISQYGRFSENGISLKYRTWYVSKEVREKYGLEDLSLKNSWQYALPVKEWKHESKEDKPDESEESAVSKLHTKSPFTGANLITKFTKVLSGEEEKKKLFNITSNNVVQSPLSSDVSASPDNSSTLNNLPATPSSGKKGRNKVNLMSVIKEKEENSKPKNSIVTMFKNIKKEKTGEEKKSSAPDEDKQLECITLE